MVCPALKTGSAEVIVNYRPILIFCNFAEVFEQVISNILTPQLLMSQIQHGFLSKRSTISNFAVLNQNLCMS